ncbi:hypothetical protein Cni_G02050 [Canna indica]|uniref:DDE Tnp4 domain-containing protein n=1 Tax=Canna indica TaxID=4628 RepID=A0AAQ3PZJ3_9LILI|nr:hypothetical protein Cni_G02050 [Canna indica]
MSHPPNNLDGDEVFENALEECLVAVAIRVENYTSPRSLHQPVRTSALFGVTYVQELMHSRVRCYKNLRMEPNLFRRLCDELRGFGLEDQRISVEEGVAMFLCTIDHNERVRVVAERYQLSTEIVHHWFKSVLATVIRLGTQIIKPRHPRMVQLEIQDETNIAACVSTAKQIMYRGRKGTNTQNIMAACAHNTMFTYVKIGWEGTVNDSRIFTNTIYGLNFDFPMPVRDKNCDKLSLYGQL